MYMCICARKERKRGRSAADMRGGACAHAKLHVAVIHINRRPPPICARAYSGSAACSRMCSLSKIYSGTPCRPHLIKKKKSMGGVP